jgi:hypothetical protein
MQMKNIIISVVTILLLCSYVNGQDTLICGTDQYMVKLKHSIDNHPQTVINFKPDSVIPIHYIPVVFHVLYTNNNSNISKEQIDNALSILNRDFRKQNPDTVDIIPEFKSLAADCRIEFRLAQIDPFGNSTEGITRTYTDTLVFKNDYAQHTLKGGIDAWPNHKYLNIWVVKQIDGFAAGGTATFPGTNPELDGILIMNNSIGTIGTGQSKLSRIFTHETGHFLYLYHVWGGVTGCGAEANCVTDDIVDDTPNTEGNCGHCSEYQYSCGTLDNVQNYMDYASREKMFTYGQRNRMLSTLNSSVGSRNNLCTEKNLIETGVIASSITPETNNRDLNINIYPNPNKGNFSLAFSSGNQHDIVVKVFNSMGNVFYESILGNSNTKRILDIQLPDLKCGIYFISVKTKTDFITEKLIVL